MMMFPDPHNLSNRLVQYEYEYRVGSTLVVENFSVIYAGKAHANHLIFTLEQDYNYSEDWKGELCCEINLKWNYDDRTLDFSIPPQNRS